MEWIRNNKTLLWLTGALSALGIVASLVFGRSMRADEIDASRLGLVTLPWLLLLAAGIPLVYEKWFGGPSPGPLFVFRRVTFRIVFAFALTIFFALYGVFILRFI